MSSEIFRKISWVTAHLTVLVVTGVLIGAFGVQFVGREFPCPLCILQRMGMILAVMGPAWMIAVGNRHEKIDQVVFTRAFGMTVLGSILGGAISIRQILLHIEPGNPGYGSPVWGLHLYTWALLVFAALLLDAGIHMTFVRYDVPIVPHRRRIISKLVLWLFWLTVLANAIAVLVEAGFHLFLPANPTSYRLLGG